MTDQAPAQTAADKTLELHLIELERQRRTALVNSDMTALAELVTDDIVHVHTTGMVHNKEQLLHHSGAFLQFLDVQRGPLLVRRLCDDAAVMTGPMVNTVKRRDRDEQVIVHAFVTQVWVRQDNVWRVASFHAVRMPDQL